MKTTRWKLSWLFIISVSFVLGLLLFLAEERLSERSSAHNVAYQLYQAIQVDITAYSPTEGQTDERPWETASGTVVTKWELKEQRLVAVSQDLIEKLGIKWGDTIWLPYIVEDTMHRKVKLGVDMFVLTEELANDIGRKTGIVLVQISKEE